MINVQCNICKNRIADLENGEAACEAYPGGIPEALMLGEVIHEASLPGDRGFKFEEKD